MCEKFQWYHIAVIVAVTVFSFLCWVGFAEGFKSALGSYVEKLSENTEYSKRLDGCIDTVDSLWYGSIFERKYLSRVDFYYTYFMTKEIASSQVVEGDNNWLFYKSSTDGNSIGDYEGTNRYSLSEMDNILNQAIATQEKLNACNIKFVIMVAPNKENIYSEYMPITYTHAEVSSTDLLIDYLATHGVNIINPKQELLEHHDEFQLYYSYDTHWNQLGAYIGVKNVLESWNIDEPALDERTISSYQLAGNYHSCGQDDLAELIGLRDKTFNDEIEYEVEGTETMNWEEFDKAPNDVQYFYNSDAKIKAKILLVGDSFRISMIPSLREMFSDVYVAHRVYYSTDLLEIEPDYLIAEYVERYSGELEDINFLVN
jgi:hypothetical protein